MNDDTMVKVGDDMVALMDIAGADLDGVEAFTGYESLPVGIYQFHCNDATLETMMVMDKDSSDKVAKPTIAFELEVTDCRQVKESGRDPTEFVGAKHFERIFINDPKRDIGKAVALMQGAGHATQGKLKDVLDAFVGADFVAAVKNRRDKNDTDKVYADLDLKKVQPVAQQVASQAATPAGTGGLNFGAKQ